MPSAELGDARLHYDTRGDAGAPVLLIMGFGVPGHMWQSQIEALSPHHRVAWFDNVGAGSSRRRRRLFSTRDLARHAVGVLDALGWDDAHVVGVSMGGMVAQEVALGHRRRVRSLSLLVTHAGGLRNTLPAPRSLLLFAKGFLGPAGSRATALEQLVYPPSYLASIDRERVARYLQEEVATAATGGERLGQIATVLTHSTGRRLRRLAGLPTLVVAARLDALLGVASVRRLHAAIPGARLLELEDAGHAVIHQCAEQVNVALLRHFAAADAERA